MLSPVPLPVSVLVYMHGGGFEFSYNLFPLFPFILTILWLRVVNMQSARGLMPLLFPLARVEEEIPFQGCSDYTGTELD